MACGKPDFSLPNVFFPIYFFRETEVIFPQFRDEKSSFFRQKVLHFQNISFIMSMLAVKIIKNKFSTVSTKFSTIIC